MSLSCKMIRTLLSRGLLKVFLGQMVCFSLILLNPHIFTKHVAGQLICFTHAPVRIVHNPLHDPSASPSAPPTSNDMQSVPRLFQSPALLSDAIRNLTMSSYDRPISISGSRHNEDGDNILHVMTDLLFFSRLKQRRASEQSRLEDLNGGYSLLPTRMMTVFLKDATFLVGADRELAKEYVFDGPLGDPTPAGMCMTNVGVAKKHGRSDHERFFHAIGMVFSVHSAKDVSFTAKDPWGSNPLAIHLVMEMCVYLLYLQKQNFIVAHEGDTGIMNLLERRMFRC